MSILKRLLVPVLLLLLSACGTPVTREISDAWAYKGYPGPLKSQDELSDVYVWYAQSYRYGGGMYWTTVTFKDVLRTIDGDDGSRHSDWNGKFGGNGKSLSAVRMWIEPGVKPVLAIFTAHSPYAERIKFDYEFKAGEEYRFICYRGVKPLTLDDIEGSQPAWLKDYVAISCYMYHSPHDTDWEKGRKDLIYDNDGKGNIKVINGEVLPGPLDRLTRKLEPAPTEGE